MSKWKWIAQDADGQVSKYIIEPEIVVRFWAANGNDYKFIDNGDRNTGWQETLINLKTEDYEIVDGILKRLPRKIKLDELIARVKLIDKKAAKWINKNRNLCKDSYKIGYAMPDWMRTPQGYDYWVGIREKLEAQQTPPKQTVRYRVSLHKRSDGSLYTMTPNTEDDASKVPSFTGFVEWLTDWIEVEV